MTVELLERWTRKNNLRKTYRSSKPSWREPRLQLFNVCRKFYVIPSSLPDFRSILGPTCLKSMTLELVSESEIARIVRGLKRLCLLA